MPEFVQQLVSSPWRHVILAVIGLFLVMGFFMTVPPPIFIWLERRIAGWVQSRIGPNRVGPFGLFQSLADALKLIVKEDIVPEDTDAFLFRFAPYLAVGGATAAFLIVPFGPNWIGSDLDLGLFWYLAAGSFVTLGIVMSGWASNNKWSMLGGARSAAQVVSYEIPVGLSLLPVIFLAGTLRPQAIIQGQGWAPHQWNLFHSPGLFFCAFFYFVAALAEINRTPFDLPEAESELVSGYNTEYSSFRWALFMLGEYADIYLISVITVLAFGGGWMHPWALQWSHDVGGGVLDAWQHGLVWRTAEGTGGLWMYLANNFLGMIIIMSKSMVLVVIIILFRWTLPRLRVDQLMAVCWKYLVPLALISVFVTAAWMVWVPPTITVGQTVITVNYDAELAKSLSIGENLLRNGNLMFLPLLALFLLPILVALGRNRRQVDFKPALGGGR